MTVDWTQLPPELLESISKNLRIYADYLRFRGVCRSWLSSTPKTPENLPPQLPWLMLPQSHHRRPNRAFFDLSSNKFHFLNLPEASRGKRCCGSSHGWLVILDESPSVLLLNPLTRAKLLGLLPPLSAFPNVLRFSYSEIGREFGLLSSTGEQYTLSLRQIRDSFIKKVVLSSSPLKANDFIAVAILNQTSDLAFCKEGDEAWSFIDGARSYSEDVVYFDGLFYAVNKYGAVAVCEVGSSPPVVNIIQTPRQVGADMQYLVNSGDDLLLVSRYLDLDLDQDNVGELYRTVGFDVFRMDWGGPKWEKVNDLVDRMLFIGQNSSLSFSASDFPGCVGNCIYFTDDYSELNYERVFGGECDSGIFRLCDGIIEGRWNSRCKEHWPTPIWVSPNPL